MKTGLRHIKWIASASAILMAAAPWTATLASQAPAEGRSPARGASRPGIQAPAAKPLDSDDARFLLERTGYTPDPHEAAQYVGLTRAQAVDKLLSTARQIAITPIPTWFDEPIPTPQERKAWTQDQKKTEQMTRNQRYQEARAWWITEMLHTPSPLTERMTLFWHNHFVSGQDKVPWPQTMLTQNLLLRREALGNFRVMLHDIAKDPAMLQYLDGASNRKGHPNENFAREVMELFTLGEGHYTQQDVTQAARAYTGWGLDGRVQFVWRAGEHDNSPKTVFGRTSNLDGDQMLDLLLAQPQTAVFVTAKLWREFISDTPDPRQVSSMARVFRAHDYDIPTVLREIFLSAAFWNQEGRGTLVRSPVDLVIGTARAFDIQYRSPQPLVATLNQLGQNVFEPPDVKGWRGGQTWINSATLLGRERFIESILRAAGEGPGSMMGGGHPPRMGPGPHFDPQRWFAQEQASETAVPDAPTRERIERAVLAMRPAEPLAAQDDGWDLFEALLTDPAYQLK